VADDVMRQYRAVASSKDIAVENCSPTPGVPT
jgi:hypothetical protein